MNDKYTVWVGGIEVNDCLLPKEMEDSVFDKIFNITMENGIQ